MKRPLSYLNGRHTSVGNAAAGTTPGFAIRTRIATAVTAVGGAALFAIGIAPAAHADVTNPAVNPHKITVTGDDGNTYVDGQDTLPGYDDEACTYIPGAYFDFENNKVRYPDGQSISWTEWDRATGYNDWLAKKSAAAPAPAATSTGTTAAAPAGAGAKPAGATKPSVASAQGSAATGAGEDAADDASASSSDPTASPEASPGARPSSEPASPEASAEGERVLSEGAAGPGGGGSSAGGSSAGLAILAGLFGAGGLAFGGYTFLRKSPSAKGA